MLNEYLKNNILITDGAMGTYYSSMVNDSKKVCEEANINDKATIENIHKEYIEAGAKLIKTNTFSANRFIFGADYSKDIIIAGIKIAKKAANKDTFIAADIGPILDTYEGIAVEDEQKKEELIRISDLFLEENIDIFIFETLADTSIIETAHYIKNKNPNTFIICSFSVSSDGFSRKGMSANKLISQAINSKVIDACGFNCGAGPSSLLRIAKDIDFKNNPAVLMPNAGMADLSGQRAFYTGTSEYFASTLSKAKDMGIKILGGCCGTTPKYIKLLSNYLKDNNIENTLFIKPKENKINVSKKDFILAAEIEAPHICDVSKCINAVKEIKNEEIDFITVSDSPLGRARMDSVMLASKLKRELKVNVIPHICCRDKNINALKASLLGASLDGIQNVLAVTGDAVNESDSGHIKGVFNLNSVQFIELISTMNKEIFVSNPFNIFAALNVNVKNPKAELEKMNRKIAKGATTFLTQPVFTAQALENLKFFYENKPQEVKILCGILPLISYKNAQFIKNEIAGITISEETVNEFSPLMDKETGEQIGINQAMNTINKVQDFCNGIYFITPFNRGYLIAKLIKEIKKGWR